MVEDSEAGQRVLDEVNERRENRKRKSANDTGLPERDALSKAAVISFADSAKIRNNLEKIAETYQDSDRIHMNTVLSELGRAIGAEQKGSNSQYVTIEAKNGNEVTIRLSDHNASVERMDNAGKDNAISIVISRKGNKGIQGTGEARIVEYYYSDKKLRQAGGKAVAAIARSLQQTLYSGEFKDTTGLADMDVKNADMKITDKVKFFRTEQGEAYGFTVGGKIYLDPRIAKADTPIHEYAHLWAEALRQGNPEEWANVVGLMKDTPVWEEVKKLYPELETDEEVADEVLATYSGRRGAERLREAMREAGKEDGLGGRLAAMEAVGRVREALQRFWHAVADFLHIRYTTAEEVADRVLSDLLAGVNPGAFSAMNNDIRFSRTGNMKEDAEAFAGKHNLNVSDVTDYADYMAQGNLMGANRAFNEMRRKIRVDNTGMNLREFVKVFAPVREELYAKYGNLDELQSEYERKAEEDRSVMEAAKKRAEAEAEAEQRRLQGFRDMTDETLDAEYVKAVEANDENRMRDLVDEAARRKGYGDTRSEYQGTGAWVAPSNPGYETDAERRESFREDGGDVNVTDIAQGYSMQPEDYFTNPRGYGNDTPHGRESAKAINEALKEIREWNNPKIKIYRAVPKTVKEGKVRNGDWVTPSRIYAEMHGNSRLEGDYRIIEQEVPANNLWWDGNDVNEWGYDDGKEYAYRNTRNNRKLNDLVTRDDQGNIIPLSKRFDYRKGDPRFRQQGGRGDATDMESKRAAVESLGRKLNVEVVFEDEASLRKQPRQYRTASGWFDRAQWRKDGRRVIHVNLSNTGDAHEAEMTVLHEAVGHMGLRELLGAENYDPFLDMVHGIIPEAQSGRLRALVFKGHPDLARRAGEGNADAKDREAAEAELRRVMADEWLAELAEVGGEPGVWEQIVESFRMLLRRLGFELSLSEADIRALLFESRRNLESSRLPGEAERIREQQRDFREAARLDRIMEADMADMEAEGFVPVEEVNARFNEELSGLTEANADRVILHLGNPSDALLSAGIPDRDIALYGNKLVKKAKEHGYSLSDVRDLPMYMQNPIAVFRGSYDNGFAVLTELDIDGNKTLVTLDVSKGEVQDLNLVTSLYGKAGEGIVNWINKGKLLWADKAKASNYLSSSAPIADATSNPRLSDAAKIVERFENPKSPEESGPDGVLFRQASNALPASTRKQRREIRRKNRMKQVLFSNEKGNGKYDSYRYYVCGLKIDEQDYTAKIVVGVKGDKKYYDHRLTQIEKGALIDNLNGLSNSVAENQNADVSIGKDTRLQELLQADASKVVDENGEPLVVYHGSRRGRFRRETGTAMRRTGQRSSHRTEARHIPIPGHTTNRFTSGRRTRAATRTTTITRRYTPAS